MKLIQRKEIEVRGKPMTVYDLYGIVMLDYLDLYRQYIQDKRVIN